MALKSTAEAEVGRKSSFRNDLHIRTTCALSRNEHRELLGTCGSSRFREPWEGCSRSRTFISGLECDRAAITRCTNALLVTLGSQLSPDFFINSFNSSAAITWWLS